MVIKGFVDDNQPKRIDIVVHIAQEIEEEGGYEDVIARLKRDRRYLDCLASAVSKFFSLLRTVMLSRPDVNEIEPRGMQVSKGGKGAYGDTLWPHA